MATGDEIKDWPALLKVLMELGAHSLVILENDALSVNWANLEEIRIMIREG